VVEGVAGSLDFTGARVKQLVATDARVKGARAFGESQPMQGIPHTRPADRSISKHAVDRVHATQVSRRQHLHNQDDDIWSCFLKEIRFIG